ncbi:MAG: hypothetical protein AB8H79_06575 [Myxococcota bacterium]
MSRPWLPVLATLIACSQAPSLPGPGLHQQVRVGDAQLRRGPIGADEGGPSVSQVLRPQPEAARGDADVRLDGRLAPGGVALHIQAVGDPDHWVLPASGVDFVVEDELQFSAQLELSYAIQSDTIEIDLAASDAEGRLGPLSRTTLSLLPDVPPSRLQVSLGWDTPVDLDLHVIDGNGVVIGAKNIAAYEPPAGQVGDPDAWMQGGFLDYDSNRQCSLDLRNRENVLWMQEPPSGTYTVYAHLFSPCDAPAVNLMAVVQQDGEVLVRARSTLYAFDSRTHDDENNPPGLRLVTFDVP